MEKLKKALGIVLFACVLGLSLPVRVWARDETEGPGNLYALSAVLMDGESGRILYEKEGSEIRPMASTTKIMTCILVLEQGDLDGIATASSYAASMPKVHLGVTQGEEFRVRDLLYSLMLESHNDSAVVLAEYTAETVEGFAARMNEKARQIGCENTWFITPNGLDAQETVEGQEKIHATTAADLARILRYCIKESPAREDFLEITRTPSYSFTDVSGGRSFSCTNHNAFLSMMDGALTGKTGFTANAGYCYVGALERDGKTLIVALLGCGWPNNKNYKWQDTRKLMEYGLANFEWHSFSQETWPDMPQSLPVEAGQSQVLGQSAQVPLVYEKAGEGEGMLLGKNEAFTLRYQGEERLQAPVEAGQQVGEVLYEINGNVVKSLKVTAGRQVEKVDFPWCLEQTLNRLLELPL